MENFILIFLVSILINEIGFRIKLLPSFTGDLHQRFSSTKSVPLTGGVILLIFYTYFFFNNNELIYFCFFSIFVLGILSDLKKIISANKRFLFQTIICFSLAIIGELEITNTRIDILDKIISNKIFNILFVTFCILIVINGSNFIDGLNTLSLGYYFLIICLLHFLKFDLAFDSIILIYIFLTLLILNLLNKLYLGDSGSYLVGFLFSYLLIKLHLSNNLISPYFIILLLWYPAMEILFSIIRKKLKNKSPMLPDNEHLHQIVFKKLNKKINKKLLSNIITALTLNSYNLIIFIIGSKFYNNHGYLITLITINIFIYLISYTILRKT
tara:strand:- start:244 stop:1224 length:981 start_codon:yes stop_codon:yes gene_type:complete